MKKRILIYLLTVTMILGIMAGCTQDLASEETEEPQAEETVVEATEAIEEQEIPEKKKVGVIIWSTEDDLSAAVKRILDYAGEALNIEVLYKTGDFDTESQVIAAENFVAAGVDGILCVPIVDSGIPRIYQVCEDAGIPYIQMFRKILDSDNAELMDTKDYFLGYTCESEVDAGYQMVQILADAGIDNIGCIYGSLGTAVLDDRKVGIEKAFEDGIANKVAEYILPVSPSSEGWVEATNNFIITFPEINGILMTTGSVGGSDASLATVEKNNAVGEVQVGMFDKPESAEEAFEKGTLAVVATGIYTDPLYSFIIMANELQGNPLSDEPIKIDGNYIYITSLEDMSNYQQYGDSRDGVYPYTVEEIQQMTKFYNPDFTAEDLQAIASQWSLDYIMETAGQ